MADKTWKARERRVCKTLEWKKARKFVWKRDGGICKDCGTSKPRMQMHIHHIVSFQNKELRADPNNLILLCNDCHIKRHSKGASK